MNGVAIRCPNCGVQQAALGECEACGHDAVRYFCGNHTPGRWLAGPSCDACGARFGDPPRRPAAPPPPAATPRPRPAAAGARRPPVSLDRPGRPAPEPAGEEVVVWTPLGPRRVRVERDRPDREPAPEYLPPSRPADGEVVHPVESVARAAGAAVGCLARTAIVLLLLLLFGLLFGVVI